MRQEDPSTAEIETLIGNNLATTWMHPGHFKITSPRIRSIFRNMHRNARAYHPRHSPVALLDYDEVIGGHLTKLELKKFIETAQQLAKDSNHTNAKLLFIKMLSDKFGTSVDNLMRRNFIKEIHTDYIKYYRTEAGREITDSQQLKEGPAAIITNSQNDESGKRGSARTAALPSARVYSANTAPDVLKDIEQEQKTIAKEKEELKHLQDERDTLKAASSLLKLNSRTHRNTLEIKTIEVESDIKDAKKKLKHSEQYFNELIEIYQNMLSKGPRCIKALQDLKVLGIPRTAEEPISLVTLHKPEKKALIIIIDDQPINIAQILDFLSSKITEADKQHLMILTKVGPMPLTKLIAWTKKKKCKNFIYLYSQHPQEIQNKFFTSAKQLDDYWQATEPRTQNGLFTSPRKKQKPSTPEINPCGLAPS